MENVYIIIRPIMYYYHFFTHDVLSSGISKNYKKSVKLERPLIRLINNQKNCWTKLNKSVAPPQTNAGTKKNSKTVKTCRRFDL